MDVRAGVTRLRSYAALADYWALTKPEVNFLIAVTTSAGFYLGYPAQSHGFPFALLIHTLLGTLLVASGAGYTQPVRRVALRCHGCGEPRDGQYLPEGLRPASALYFGIFLSLAGSIYLAWPSTYLRVFWLFWPLVTYLFLYTPLKRKTPLCTLVGAFPGAMPPLIGWAAASGNLSLGSMDTCMPCSSFGSFLILWPSHGCIARTSPGRVTWFFLTANERAALWLGRV